MVDSISLQRFKSEVLPIFVETFEQVQGMYLDRGTSLFETLDTISAEVASRPVGANCASIAAQVEHVRFYLEVIERLMVEKVQVKADWKDIWENVHEVTPEEWETSKSNLRETYQRITKRLQDLETWDVADENEGENDFAGALAMLVHTAYHLGEIRQALCTVG